METDNKVVEIDYKVPKLGKNFAGKLFDLFSFIMLGVLLTMLTVFLIDSNPTYNKWVSYTKEVRETCNLFKEERDEETDESSWYKLSDYYKRDHTLTADEKSEAMDKDMTDFLVYLDGCFSSKKESPIGQTAPEEMLIELKWNCIDKDSGEHLFDKKTGERVKIEDKYDQLYLEARYDIFETYVIGYLNYVPNYLEYSKKINTVFLIFIPLTFVIAYAVIYYAIPMILNKGKRTLGMLITNTALLYVNGFSCGNLRYTLKFLFKLFVILIGSAIAFLIPLAVSITMLFMFKNHQCLSDYVTNTYLVSTDEKSIYSNYSEMTSFSKKNKKKMSIEDKDLILK